MYAEDLAHIQHVGYGDFARQASPGLLSLLRAAGMAEGTVLDLGCGAGVWLRELQRAGYIGRGIDSSAALVRIARRVARGATVKVGSVYTESLPQCDAITAIGEVLSYCPPNGRPPPALGGFFARVARSLRPGGLFLFDVLVEGRRLAKPHMESRIWLGRAHRSASGLGAPATRPRDHHIPSHARRISTPFRAARAPDHPSA